jgi:hypothetical protein
MRGWRSEYLNRYLTSQQRGETPAPPQPEGLRGFWPGALLLVSQRPQWVFSLLAPRTQPKFAAALLYESQTWCTSPAGPNLTPHLYPVCDESEVRACLLPPPD